eukprot:3573821-Karenia_brevis.AAC.1
MAAACRLRFWHSVQPWGKELYGILRDNVHRTLGDVANNSFSPTCWQWPSIIVSMHDFAQLNWGKSRRDKQFLQLFQHDVPDILAGERIQNAFYIRFLELFYPRDFEARMSKAFSVVGQPPIHPPLQMLSSDLLQSLKKVGPHLALAWLKTVSNGWATTARVR